MRREVECWRLDKFHDGFKAEKRTWLGEDLRA